MSIMKRDRASQSLVVPNGTTTSGSFNNDRGGAFVTFGLQMPAAFTGATISFTVSLDNVTFQALYDKANALVSVTVAVNRTYALPAELAGWPYWKVVSASNEAAERTIKVLGVG